MPQPPPTGRSADAALDFGPDRARPQAGLDAANQGTSRNPSTRDGHQGTRFVIEAGSARGVRALARRCLHRATQVLGGITLACIAQAGTAATPPEYRIGPAPEWVTRVERGTPNDSLREQVSGGVYYLLSDSQEMADPHDRLRFHRIASQAITTEGVQSIANISIAFDPSYQTLQLHWIDVIRDQQVIPKLGGATIRLLQRETELERRIYDGSTTAAILLDDVRVGDIVDYAYSVRGLNPVFSGKPFGRLGLRFDVPVARVHVGIAVPENAAVELQPHETSLEASTRAQRGLRFHSWQQDDVPALITEADEPGWYDPRPAIQWSAFHDWNAVARWAWPLYRVPDSPSTTLQAEADRIRQAEPGEEGRLLSALRFVQRDIRYLGMAMGAGSHAPAAPDTVLERRFGDCKDKTLLLLTLLDRLGIEARAAFVNTELRRGAADRQPSPGVFDHVLVRARIGDAQYWLDPTRQPQMADLAHLTQADFGVALIVDPQTRTLTPMSRDDQPVPLREVRLSYDAKSGFEQPVALTVTTTASGERADILRQSIASSNGEALQKSYLNFYAGTYPDIRVSAPMQVQDDEPTNRITVTEHYSIANLAVWSEEDHRFNATFSAPDTLEVLRVPASAARTAPIALAHPTDLTVVTEVKLPEEWPIKAERVVVEDPAFVFERTISSGPKRFSITDRYRSLGDAVAAEDAVRYANAIAKARDNTFYQLHWTDPGRAAAGGLADRINWLVLMVGVMALGLWIWLAVRAWHGDPPPIGLPASPSAPSGLRGWLALATLGVTVTPFVMMFGLYNISSALTPVTWAALTTYGTDTYHPLWAPALLFEVIGILGLMVFWGLVCVLFYQRRTSAPYWYIRMLIASVFYTAIDSGLMVLLPAVTLETKDIAGLVRQALTAAIWIAYFMKSERVRATFVKRLGPAPAQPELGPVAGSA